MSGALVSTTPCSDPGAVTQQHAENLRASVADMRGAGIMSVRRLAEADAHSREPRRAAGC